MNLSVTAEFPPVPLQDLDHQDIAIVGIIYLRYERDELYRNLIPHVICPARWTIRMEIPR